MSKKDLFVSKSKKVHGDIYSYDDVQYLNCHEKVSIFCKKCNLFFSQKPSSHARGSGCPKCWGGKRFKSQDVFLKECIAVHGGKYDYSLVKYVSSVIKVDIICKTHGKFNQIPTNHLQGYGCNRCGYDRMADKLRLGIDSFKLKAIEIHGNFYDYSKCNYTSAHDKIKILCPIHGGFYQTPNDHVEKRAGCPDCKESKGEVKIKNELNKRCFSFKFQHKFDGCFLFKKLPFDFYIPSLNLCIEYQGKQHYQPIKFFGGVKALKKQQKRDQIKRNFCRKEGIDLLEISYKDFNRIEQILTNKLFQEKQLTLF